MAVRVVAGRSLAARARSRAGRLPSAFAAFMVQRSPGDAVRRVGPTAISGAPLAGRSTDFSSGPAASADAYPGVKMARFQAANGRTARWRRALSAAAWPPPFGRWPAADRLVDAGLFLFAVGLGGLAMGYLWHTRRELPGGADLAA